MPEEAVLRLSALPAGTMKTVTVGETKILLVRTGDVDGQPALFALEAECPHAKAPLEQGVVCNGRLVCPWHMGTFELATGALVEPPPLRALKRYAVRVLAAEGEAEGAAAGKAAQIMVDPAPLLTETPDLAESKHFIFAGAGAATAAAVCHLRERGFSGGLTVIEPVADEPVDRTVLTKAALSGEKKLTQTPLFTPAETARLRLHRVQGEVASIDVAAKSLTTDAGKTLWYDSLMLATGGAPKRPDITGAHFKHVITIRHTADLEPLLPRLTTGARVVIVGDSFIAFEAASCLREHQVEVTVVARSKLPFAKQFGPDVANALLALHRKQGVVVLASEEVTSIGPDSVMLKSGSPLLAETVLLAVGVTPLTGYAPELPHAADGGFAVGTDLQLAQNIYAAGDIASVDGTRIEHWRLAQQHGRIAAEAMLATATGAAPPLFAGVPFFWTYFYGKRYAYLGHPQTWDCVEIIGSLEDMNFVVLYSDEGRLVAALGCQKDSAMAALAEPMRGSLTLADARMIVKTAA